MPNRNYRRGAAHEYAVAKKYREMGYVVLRSAGSHGEFDLCAIKSPPPTRASTPFPDVVSGRNMRLWFGEIKLIQCKVGKSKKRAIKEVLASDIKRFEGLYAVSVEVM